MTIFLTVGLHEQPFDRLVKAVDLLEVETKIIQRGHSVYEPKHSQVFKFLNFEEILYYLQKSNVVITHGGTGSIMLALSAGKKPIVAPRYKKFGEHVDDHQFEIVKKLAEMDLIIPFYDGDDLSNIIFNRNFLTENITLKSRKIDEVIHSFLNAT